MKWPWRLVASRKGTNPSGGLGGTPYMGDIGMCGPEEVDFSAILIIQGINFGHFRHIEGMVFAL